MQKNSVRKNVLSEVKSLETELRRAKSKLISKQLFAHLSSNYDFNGLKLAGYCPMGWEVQWHCEFTKQCDLYLPQMQDDHSLLFYKSSWDQLGKETFEHDGSEVGLPEVLIVPGIAFTATGERLGRGKGYYDRYLEDFKGLVIGVCYEEALLEDLPLDDHDEKMNLVITDKRIYQ